MTAVLPPWSGIDVSCDKKIKENQLEPEKQEQRISTKEETVVINENTGNKSKQVEITSEDLTYSNIENVQGAITTQQNPESQGCAVPPGGEQSNDVYEVVSSVWSAPPPKPLPYSVSKKAESGSGTACHDENLREAEKVLYALKMPLQQQGCYYLGWQLHVSSNYRTDSQLLGV